AVLSLRPPPRPPLFPYTTLFRSKVTTPGHAVAAAAADDVAFARDDHAGLVVVDVVANLDDFADEFVADDHRHRDRLLRPLIPFIDVDVGAADRGPLHADLHIVGARLRLRHIFQPKPTFGLAFDQRFQRPLPRCRSSAVLTSRLNPSVWKSVHYLLPSWTTIA